MYVRQEQSLDNDVLSLEETLFHSANGYIGVRGAFEEGYPHGFTTVRGSYVNGVYDIVPMPQAEPLHGLVTKKQTLVNVADVQDLRLYVDGELCTAPGKRTLDMRQGTVTRSFVWKSTRGRTVRVTIIRMASFVRLPLFLLTYTIETDGECKLDFVAAHHADVLNFSDSSDPRVASHSRRHIIIDDMSADSGEGFCRSVISTHTRESGIGIVTGVHDVCGADPADVTVSTGAGFVSRTFSLKATAGTPVIFSRYAVFADSRRYNSKRYDSLQQECIAIMEDAVRTEKVLYAEQSAYLDDFWKDLDFGVDGDNRLSAALTFNIYQLLQSVGKDEFSHLSAKGLSGEGYEGHYFWDTEMYVQPLFTLTRPEISRQLLAYRYAILPQARENARHLGHQHGALYPWRTISGEECSGFFPAGTAQYHIDGAVAYAVVMYWQVTGDKDFMEDMGLEMLLEIARLWADLGTYCGGKFHLHCVTGPDEYTCIVNNNYYTNISAQYDLRWAVRLFRDFDAMGRAQKAKKATGITAQELLDFSRAADAMYLPYDAERDITPQDDSFLSKKVWDLGGTPQKDFPLLMHYHPLVLYRYQVCKQADTILAHVLYEKDADYSTRLNSFRYYEKLTTHDSSLSTCIFSIAASRLGLVDEAYEYFGDSVEIDINNTHGNTKDGIHTANMGGSCMAILFGFAGFYITEKGFCLSPSIPRQWEGYHFRLRLNDCAVMVRVNHETVTLYLLEGEEEQLYLYGEPVRVTQEKKVFALRTSSERTLAEGALSGGTSSKRTSPERLKESV